jgi:hypothetical protein
MVYQTREDLLSENEDLTSALENIFDLASNGGDQEIADIAADALEVENDTGSDE